MVNACCNEPRIARHVYLRFLSGTVTVSNVPLVLCNLHRNNNSAFNSAFSYDLPKYLNQTTSGRDTQ